MEVSRLLREFLEVNHDKFDIIILCLFIDKDKNFYTKYLQEFFPIPTSSSCHKITTTIESPKLLESNTEKPLLKLPEKLIEEL